MVQRLTTLALALLLIGSLTSCIFDPKTSPPKPPDDKPVLVYENLTEKWHVLNNLQLSYTEKSSTKYKEILDSVDFIFFKDPNDVGPGEDSQWGYTTEAAIADNMLNKLGTNPILSIDLELVDFKNAQWEEVVDNPGWWQTTVQYNFSIVTQNDITYVTSGTPSADFIVRQDGEGKWRLIRWWDKATN